MPNWYSGTSRWVPNVWFSWWPMFASRWHYWTLVVILIVTVIASLHLRDSRLGRAWIAIREDETAAAAMGVPLMRTKTWAYATGAFFGGIAGAYYASFKSATFPGDFFFNISVFILCMVILGGMGNIWGVIFGVLIGWPTLRLRGDYLAIVTLGFGEVIRVLANNLDKPINLTNGPKGITPIA